SAQGDGRRSAGRDHQCSDHRASGRITGSRRQLMPALAQELFALGMTVALARRALTDAFRQAELDSPELDARLLVGHALGLDHTALTIDSGRSLGSDAAHTLAALAARRLEREPVARIVGVKEFWGLPLRLNDATLVPRPETETVDEAAL